MDENYERLVQTLMSNRLAASASEANRMAQEMLGTSKKVNDGFQKDKFYAVRNFTREKEKEVNSQPPSSPNASPAEQKIEEFRQSAINPKPVDVQVNFQTPQTDAQNIESTPVADSIPQPEPPAPQVTEPEPIPQNNESLNADMPPAPAPVKAEPVPETTPAPQPQLPTGDALPEQQIAQPQKPMTPEEYSAAQMGGNVNTANTSDFLSLKQEEQAPKQDEFTTDAGKPEFDSTSIPTSTPDDFPGEKPEVQSSELFNNVPPPEPQQTEFSNPVKEEVSEQQSPYAQETTDQQPVTEPEPQFAEPTPTPQPEQAPATQGAWPEQANQGNNSNWSNNQLQEEQTQQQAEDQIPKPTRRGTWSEEDKKLAKDVDITKLFNFSGR